MSWVATLWLAKLNWIWLCIANSEFHLAWGLLHHTFFCLLSFCILIYLACMWANKKKQMRSNNLIQFNFNSLLFNQMRYAQCITPYNFHFIQHAPKTICTLHLYASFCDTHPNIFLFCYSSLAAPHARISFFEGNVLQKKPCIFYSHFYCYYHYNTRFLHFRI